MFDSRSKTSKVLLILSLSDVVRNFDGNERSFFALPFGRDVGDFKGRLKSIWVMHLCCVCTVKIVSWFAKKKK